MIKYRVHEVAKDFKLNSKDIAEIMTKYCTTPKNHMQVLTDLELAIIFERVTQDNQIASIESVFAEVYHEPEAEPAPAPAVDSSWTTNPAAKNLPEPPATYAVAEKQSSDTFCLIEITNATFNEIVTYGAMLRDCGFNIDVQENSEETADKRILYKYKAKNADGCSVSLNFSTMEGTYTMTYVEVYSK